MEWNASGVKEKARLQNIKPKSGTKHNQRSAFGVQH